MLRRAGASFSVERLGQHVYNFITQLLRVPCQLDIWMKLPSSMHSFIAQFYRQASTFNCWLVLMIKYIMWPMESWWICVDKTQMLSMEFHSSFMTLGNCAHKFHLHETPFFSFFLNSMPCHHFCLCDMPFNENETHIKPALRIALDLISRALCASPFVSLPSSALSIPAPRTRNRWSCAYCVGIFAYCVGIFASRSKSTIRKLY